MKYITKNKIQKITEEPKGGIFFLMVVILAANLKEEI